MGKDKKKKNRGKAGGKTPKKKGPTLAERADKHELYQIAVQSPDADIEFFDRVYRETRGRAPMRFREDFCGTGILSATWVESEDGRRAFGVDLDGPTLDWGRAAHERDREPEVLERLELAEANVLDAKMPADGVGADVSCAMNFSFCVFKEREVLKKYLAAALKTLAPGGLFFMEMYGGTESMIELEDDRELEGFTYQWDQHSFNPLTHETLCYIHFAFPDGSKIRKAFTYDWRLWTVPELRDLLLEVGFEKVRVFWETVEDDEDDPTMMTGTGEYEEVEEVENQDSWLVYVVGERAEAS